MFKKIIKFIPVCDRCKKECKEGVYSSEEEAIRRIKTLRGWFYIDGKVYCGNCLRILKLGKKSPR